MTADAAEHNLADLQPGEPIQIRDALGAWHDSRAQSTLFLNTDYVGRQEPWLVVQVHHPGFDHLVNWPASDVRRPPSGPELFGSEGVGS